MADNPQKTMANRTDRAETEMFLRRVLLKYGYDNLPDNVISGALMRLGPLGDIAGMMGMDFLARALTPRGTNIAPAGAAADGTPLIELFDVAMRNSRNQAAKGMAGEAVAMGGAAALGLSMTGPVGIGIGLIGNFAARSGIRALTPPNWLRRMFVQPGTNLQAMNMLQLSREMVTFTRAKFIGHEGLILSGSDIEKIAGQPSENANALTVKFDKIWKLEKELKNPELGPLHQLVKALANHADQAENPMTVLAAESFDKDPSHPFYTASVAVKSPVWEIATDSLLALSGIPDLSAANTAHVMATHRAAMVEIKDKELKRAQLAGAEAGAEDFRGRDWSNVPDNQIVVIGAKHNDKGIKTESFRSMQTADGVVFLGREGDDPYGKRYTAEEFKKLVDVRESLISIVQITPSRTPISWIFLETDTAPKPSSSHAATDTARLGRPVQFMASAENNPDATRARATTGEPQVVADQVLQQVQKLQPAQTLG
ncbi:MAG TPA: hypothetical protein PKW15_02135 [Alphaproteobacteria bacterium]|nr:hypothetical protein [Rhodospirillaceae bacterium]HRJ12023.1 hypothetical protein [Alphaproteobacteria bacterium]